MSKLAMNKPEQREIKFRAWNRQLDVMVNEAIDIGKLGVHAPTMQHKDVKARGDVYELMQYTGLKDKNGTEIYEGDILLDPLDEYISGKVTWWDNNARFFLSNLNDDYMGDDDNADEPMEWVKYEVIGNIYENPELL